MSTRRFSAEIFRPEGTGTSTFLIAPFDPKAVFGKARAPVKVTINGHTFPTTIAIYGGKPYIGLNAEVRKAAGVDAGDVVEVVVAADADERVVDVPADLQVVLDDDEAANAAWAKLSYTHRKEHVRAIAEAKKAETRARRIDNCLRMLRDGK